MTGKKILGFIKKYWRYILIAVGVLLLVRGGLSLYNGVSDYIRDHNSLKADNEILDGRERENDRILEDQFEYIATQDARIDSFRVEISKKEIRIEHIPNEIQLLKGDSLLIASILNRILN